VAEDLVPAVVPQADAQQRAVPAGTATTPASVHTQALACVDYVGQLVARLCASPALQTQWNLGLQVDPDLLPDTHLQLSYCPARLWLEFRSQSWTTREFLQPHLALFEGHLQQRMPPTCAVVVTLL
jgi:Type III secretion protein (HpaP)